MRRWRHPFVSPFADGDVRDDSGGWSATTTKHGGARKPPTQGPKCQREKRKLTLLQKTNQAELMANTPLTLLTNPYANNADMPSLLSDSRLNLALLFLANSAR